MLGVCASPGLESCTAHPLRLLSIPFPEPFEPRALPESRFGEADRLDSDPQSCKRFGVAGVSACNGMEAVCCPLATFENQKIMIANNMPEARRMAHRPNIARLREGLFESPLAYPPIVDDSREPCVSWICEPGGRGFLKRVWPKWLRALLGFWVRIPPGAQHAI